MKPLRRPRTVMVLAACLAMSLFAMSGTHTTAGQPGTGNVTVELEVHTCPEGTDPAVDRETLVSTCLEPADPYAITIGNGSTWADGDDTTGEAPQVVQFSEVPAGVIQLMQALPDGMGEPVIFRAEGSSPVSSPIT